MKVKKRQTKSDKYMDGILNVNKYFVLHLFNNKLL